MLYRTILLSLAASCPIYIGQQIFSDKKILAAHIHGKQILIVTQKRIADYYLPALQLALQDFHCDVIFLPEGEQHKNLSAWQKILDELARQQHERSTTLIALGGGIVGDITGFAAACYQRGVNYLQIATTLIAQVDSAIGGKTAVNHALGKNRIGVFHQPQCVISDISLLQTLSQREYKAGLAEVIKYALIQDAEFFVWLENNMNALLARDSHALLHAIAVSTAIKTQIVMQDEFDRGVRCLLNFGHTFGHALEAANAYQGILHGEAVLHGMAIAVDLSAKFNGLDAVSAERIMRLLTMIDLEDSFVEFPDSLELIRWMKHDKKVTNGKINLILLREIGNAEKTDEITEAQIKTIYQNIVATDPI